MIYIFLKALSDMYTIKSKSREIYTILPYDDITIIIIIIILATIIIIIEIFFGHPRKTFFLCPKKRTKLHWGEGGVSDKKEAKCDIHRYAPFLRQVRKSTYFGMKINFEEIFLRGSVIVCFWKSFYFSKDCFAIFVMKIAIVLVERFKNAPKKL